MKSQNIGLWVGARRKEVGLTQHELGSFLSYTPQAISLMEQGKSSILVSTLYPLAQALRCSPEDVLSCVEHPETPKEYRQYDSSAFAYCVFKHRKNSGMRQADIASALGVSARTLRSYEKGRATPNIDFLLAFLDYFHLELVQMEEKPKRTLHNPPLPLIFGALFVSVASGLTGFIVTSMSPKAVQDAPDHSSSVPVSASSTGHGPFTMTPPSSLPLPFEMSYSDNRPAPREEAEPEFFVLSAADGDTAFILNEPKTFTLTCADEQFVQDNYSRGVYFYFPEGLRFNVVESSELTYEFTLVSSTVQNNILFSVRIQMGERYLDQEGFAYL